MPAQVCNRLKANAYLQLNSFSGTFQQLTDFADTMLVFSAPQSEDTSP